MQTKNHILASLTPDAQAYLRENSDVREMLAGDVVFAEDAPVTHAVFPHNGVISVMAEMRDLRTVEKISIGREGVVGYPLIMGGGSSMGQLVVQVRGEATWVSIEKLDVALQRYGCVGEALLRFARSHIVQLAELVACNSLHTAEQRISRWLMHAHDRIDGDMFYLTQESLARILALRRATVNTVCTELMDIGAIEYHRGSLTITDRDLLESRACECYERIKKAEALAFLPAPDEAQ